ncbi:MAG TPA: amidohydrolase, partial [Thermodesulfobacteriota bacterium]|nr:amidohydrolase [Thermodesulfobacteriota bacterium]
ITKGGDLVNVVPADVRIETFVRGKTVEAIQDAHVKVNRALKAGAMAIGAEVQINNLPGYLPSLYDPRLEELFGENMKALLGPDCVGDAGHQTGSSDIGDISHLMPALHAFIRGGSAQVHTEGFGICEPRLAYVESAKGLAMTAVDLLWDGAREGLAVKAGYKPRYNKEQYLTLWDDLCRDA